MVLQGGCPKGQPLFFDFYYPLGMNQLAIRDWVKAHVIKVIQAFR